MQQKKVRKGALGALLSIVCLGAAQNVLGFGAEIGVGPVGVGVGTPGYYDGPYYDRPYYDGYYQRTRPVVVDRSVTYTDEYGNQVQPAVRSRSGNTRRRYTNSRIQN